MEVGGQLHAPTDLIPRKQASLTVAEKRVEPRSLSGSFGKEENLLVLPAVEPNFLGLQFIS